MSNSLSSLHSPISSPFSCPFCNKYMCLTLFEAPAYYGAYNVMREDNKYIMSGSDKCQEEKQRLRGEGVIEVRESSFS